MTYLNKRLVITAYCRFTPSPNVVLLNRHRLLVVHSVGGCGQCHCGIRFSHFVHLEDLASEVTTEYQYLHPLLQWVAGLEIIQCKETVMPLALVVRPIHGNF